MPTIDITVVTGTKSFVNNKVVCLGGGICSIKVHIGRFRTNGLGVDDNGNLYLVIKEDLIDDSLKTDFVLKEDVTFETGEIDVINDEARKVNPATRKFTGLQKGYLLHPEKQDGYYYIKIN